MSNKLVQPTPPFQVHLSGVSESEGTVTCLSVERCIPGKRLACFARWKNRDVFIKLFTDPRRARVHWQKEERGMKALEQHGILAPAMLFSGAITDSSAYILIFERVTGALNFRQAWDAADEDRRRGLLHDLMMILAVHHNAGLRHTDLHLKNFLLKGLDIFTLDGAEIEMHDTPLSETLSLDNLGVLFAQVPVEYDRLAITLLPEYTLQRGWSRVESRLGTLQACIHGRRERRKSRYLAKVFRECHDFVSRQSATHFMVCDRDYYSDAMQSVLSRPDACFNQPAKLLKEGNTSTVALITVDGRPIVIKRYNIKGIWHGVTHAARSTRASLSWRNAHRLKFYGVATARPVALMERRIGPLRSVSYYLTEYVDGTRCRDYFLSADITPVQKDRVMDGIARLFDLLKVHRITCGDTKAANILIVGGQPVLIDLDAMRQHRSQTAFQRSWSADHKRFMENWDDMRVIHAAFSQKPAFSSAQA